MSLDLQRALEELYGLERRRDKLGLSGTRALLETLGHPERSFHAVHVAGTNGKGSVCALVERVLRDAGFRTGLFTSPHLVDFRERIRISGRWAEETRLGERLDRLKTLPGGDDRTFFEVTTALAFDAFAAEHVDWAIVEVGLGGRLDTTNVLEPDITAITSIGLDHTEILGTTIAAIAAEKAGIVKRKTPVVSGALAADAERVVRDTAAERSAPYSRAGDRVALSDVTCGPDGVRFRARVAPWGTLGIEMTLRGRHQLENAVVALALLATLADSGAPISADHVRSGFARARWPGRLEPCPREPRLWWDGAHNPDGVTRAVSAWTDDIGFPPPGALVFATARDKDAEAMLRTLRAWAGGAPLVLTRSTNPRAREPGSIQRLVESAGGRVEVSSSVAEAVRLGLELGGANRTLLLGSLMAVGEAMVAFGGAPGEFQ